MKKSAIAILTNFQDFNPGYSLTGIVIDQAEMLLKHGHDVRLFVNERFNGKHNYLLDRLDKYSDSFQVLQVVPFGHLKDYNTSISWTPEHQYLSCRVADVLEEKFKEHGIKLAFTHDWIFTGWNLPYAGGVRFASALMPNVAWMHWVHSVPSVNRDWWKLELYGPAHRIVFPNVTDQRRVAEQFQTDENNVFCIPHIKDLRTWHDMSDDTKQFIDDHPRLLEAEMVQIYPASSDRLHAKGIDKILKIFGAWKRHGISGCLVIANQWATGKNAQESRKQYYDLAKQEGLGSDELIFTSEYSPKYAHGISGRMLRELLLLSNVFFFPTREESFGLVGPEACLCGVLPVFNGSLTMMRELYDSRGLYFDFGSFHNNFDPQQGWDKYLEAVAMVTYSNYLKDQSARAKTVCRQRYNSNYLYKKYYKPCMLDIMFVANSLLSNPENEATTRNAMLKFESEWKAKQEEDK